MIREMFWDFWDDERGVGVIELVLIRGPDRSGYSV